MSPATLHSAWTAREAVAKPEDAPPLLFPWWSFTKTVMAAGALRLAEQGKLDLDAGATQGPFTVRQLLQHRTGVPNYGQNAAYHNAVAANETPWSRDRLLQAVGADSLLFAPGRGWAYSNVGYMYVRELIEEVTGGDLAAALDALVLRPLGLTSVRLARTVGDFGAMHWPRLRRYDPGWVFHGCLVGTASDAARLLHAMARGTLLASGSMLEMLDAHGLGGPIAGRPWTATGYGLGLMAGRMGAAGQVFGHSGAGPFCSNAVYHFPDLARPVTVAVFGDSEDEGIAEAEAVRIALASR